MFLKLLFSIVIVIFNFNVLLGVVNCEESVVLERKYSLDRVLSEYEVLSKEYDKLIKSSPEDVALRMRLARFYYQFRDYSKVKTLLIDMNTKEAKMMLAKSFVKLKEYNQAIELYEQLKPLPKESEYLYLYGEVLEKNNLFTKAIEIYKKVKEPFYVLAQNRLKKIQSAAGGSIPVEVIEISKQAEEFIEEVKDEAAIILLVDEKNEITIDNTSVFQVHIIKKVLSERGKGLAEVKLGYDSTYERLEIEFARTITKEGKVIYAGEENVRDVSRYLNYPLYSNSRVRIISMPAVDVGSIIEYKVKIHSSKLIAEDNFCFIYRLREANPIFKANFQFIIPKTSNANFKFFNQKYAEDINLKPVLEENDNNKIYVWKFNKIKSIIPEYAMPPISLVNPGILVSSFSSWDQIYKWWKSLYNDKIELSQEIKDLVVEITKDLDKDLDKAKEIYEFVAKNIRYVAIEYGDSGYEPHHVQEVFTNRYGDCKDQAILLTAMLRESGLSAYPVLIPTRSVYSIDKKFPSMNFNHAICVLKNGEELIFMDPTAETTPFLDIPISDQDRDVMIFYEDGWDIVNTGQMHNNKINYEMKIFLDKEENALIDRKVVTKGYYAAAYRQYLKYTHPEIIKEDIQKKTRDLSSMANLLNYNIENGNDFDKDPILTYSFKAEKFLNPASKFRIIPVLDQLYLDRNLIGKEFRKFPIDNDAIFSKVAAIRVILPENLKVKYLPKSKNVNNDWFNLEVSYQANSDTIDFYQKVKTNKRFVEVDEYDDFKKNLEDAIYLLREEIILEKFEL
ncbi:MAG: DUF3857 domain-containing protein [Candidatus Omnitrophica bacterium]|nr:DUF3857 domain-containing protein [Candidatus Omnitrophota bacterium]